MVDTFYFLHWKTCSHGDPWPCEQPEGFMSCGDYNDAWTVGRSDDRGKTFDVIGTDCPQDKEKFDRIVAFEVTP